MFLRTLTGFAVNSKINTLGREWGWGWFFYFFILFETLFHTKNPFALFDFWNEVANVLGFFFLLIFLILLFLFIQIFLK